MSNADSLGAREMVVRTGIERVGEICAKPGVVAARNKVTSQRDQSETERLGLFIRQEFDHRFDPGRSSGQRTLSFSSFVYLLSDIPREVLRVRRPQMEGRAPARPTNGCEFRGWGVQLSGGMGRISGRAWPSEGGNP